MNWHNIFETLAICFGVITLIYSFYVASGYPKESKTVTLVVLSAITILAAAISAGLN